MQFSGYVYFQKLQSFPFTLVLSYDLQFFTYEETKLI